MTFDLIPCENAREIRAEHAAITMIIARDDSPAQIAAAQFAIPVN